MKTSIREQCLNCQAELSGPFCSQCGQARSARMVPVKEWLRDFSKVFVDFDLKLVRTLKDLFLRPGQPTVDFAEGRRVPFSGPVRTYIIVSAVSIAAMTLHGVFSSENQMQLPAAKLDGDFQKRAQLLFPFVNLLSPFLTAGVLAVFQRRQFFQLHLAFSLHIWTFFVALGTPLIFIPPTSIWALAGFGLIVVTTISYIYLAHQRVYQLPLLEKLFGVGVVLFSIPLATIVFGVLLVLLASILP